MTKLLGEFQIVYTVIRRCVLRCLIWVYALCSGLSVGVFRMNMVHFRFSPDVSIYSKLSSRKHAYSNILKILPPKIWKFSDKNSDIFHISAQNIDCGYSLEPPRRGGSNEYPQSMFLSRNKKDNLYPCKPQFYYKKVGFKGSKLYRRVFVMAF